MGRTLKDLSVTTAILLTSIMFSGCMPQAYMGFQTTNPCSNEIREINGEYKNCRVCQYDPTKPEDIFCD